MYFWAWSPFFVSKFRTVKETAHLGLINATWIGQVSDAKERAFPSEIRGGRLSRSVFGLRQLFEPLA
jgi:hypothetical protein